MARGTMRGLRTALCLTLILAGCGSKENRRPPPWPLDTYEDDRIEDSEVPAEESPTCTIQKPTANRILTGTFDVRAVASDPKGEAISRVVFAFLPPGKAPVKVGEVQTVPADGTVTITADSRLVEDGPHTFFCQVEAADGRKGSSGVPVTVDNSPPTVALYPPSTPPNSNFYSDLVVRVSVTDGKGVGTAHVVIRVNGDAVADLVKPASGLQNPVTVPTHELLIGKNKVEITASDLAGNTMPSPLSYTVNFVPPPAFLTASEWTLPKDLACERVVGIETMQGAGLLCWGNKGAHLLLPSPKKTFNVGASLVTNAVSLARVADLNGDRLDDVLLVTSETGDKAALQFVPQAASGSFLPVSWKATLDGRVNDVAVGDLNGDSQPDLAVALNKAGASVAVALSKASGPAGSWSGFSAYGGVIEPNLIAIGDFTADGDNDVMVTRRASGVVTVFPVNRTSGTLLVGVNTDLQYESGDELQSLSTIKAMVPGPPLGAGKGDSVVVADADRNSLFLVSPDPGAGLGALAVVQQYPSSLTPSGLASADADGDGRHDLLAWCPGSALVLLFWGNGNGYEEGAAYLAGQQAADATFARVTGGPRPDIVILDRTNQKAQVLAAQPGSARGFTGVPMVRLGFRPLAVTAGRYLKPLAALPSHRDLALLGGEGGKASVYLIASSEDTRLPTQKAGLVDARVQNPTDLLSADLDKNGYDDLLVPSQTTSAADAKDPTMGRLLFVEGFSHLKASLKQGNDPVTGQDLQNGLWAGSAPTLAVVADLKRESGKPGVLDLAVIAKFLTAAGGEPVLLFQPFVGEGDGTFKIQEGVLYPVNENQKPSALAASRLTGGSNYDVVMTYGQSGEFTVFFAKGAGLFKAGEGEAEEFAVGQNPKRIAAEVLDAPIGSPEDPYPEIVVLLESDVAVVRALGKVGDAVQYAPPAYLGHTGRGPADLALRDVNGDGYADIVVLDEQDAMVTVYLNLAQGRFSEAFRYPVGVSPVRMMVADLDADSCPDIATADQGGQTVTLLRNLACAGL